jgi:hypothetical protein
VTPTNQVSIHRNRHDAVRAVGHLVVVQVGKFDPSFKPVGVVLIDDHRRAMGRAAFNEQALLQPCGKTGGHEILVLG